MNFIKKLQNQSEKKRKLILWSIIIILSLFLGGFWINSSYKSLKNVSNINIFSGINISEIEKEIKEIQKIDFSFMTEEEIEEIKRDLERLEKELEEAASSIEE